MFFRCLQLFKNTFIAVTQFVDVAVHADVTVRLSIAILYVFFIIKKELGW